MMTDEQRYLFDLFGYLHLKNALTPKELNAASEAANRYIESAPEDRPPHFKGSLTRFSITNRSYASRNCTKKPPNWSYLGLLLRRRNPRIGFGCRFAKLLSCNYLDLWSGRKDLNLRPPAPESRSMRSEGLLDPRIGPSDLLAKEKFRSFGSCGLVLFVLGRCGSVS